MRKQLFIYILFLSLFFGFSAQAQFPAPYCTWNVDYDVEPITYVKFAGIENSSSNVLNGTPAHQDFTNIVGNVCAGGTYTIEIQGNTSGSYYNDFFLYIDWNQDNTFDQANERYYLGDLYNSNGSATSPKLITNITVPSTALNGTTRMRVVKRYDNMTHAPCGSVMYGQAEDYTIEVGITMPFQIGFSAAASPFNTLMESHVMNAPTNWSNGICRGSGTSSIIPGLIEGVAYLAENNSAGGTCSPHLQNAMLQVWGVGTDCNGFTPVSTVETNSVEFIANADGDHKLHISSNLCGSTVNNTCVGGFGHDFTGQSAALRYRQATTIENTTSNDTLCLGNPKPISYILNGNHNNPDVEFSITQGASLGSIVNNEFIPSGIGDVTIRAKVGVLYDDVSFYIKQNDTTQQILSICPGDLPYTWNGLTWGTNTVPGVYYDTVFVTNPTGCDTVFTVELIVNPEHHVVDQVNLCTSQLPYNWNGLTIPTGTLSNSAYDSVILSNQYGCDSLVVLDLTVNSSDNASQSLTICSSELPYSWYNETIPLGTMSGTTFTYFYTNSNGCDSVINLQVFINPVYETEIHEVICEGDTLFVGAEYFTQETIQQSVALQTINGCDSVIIVNVQINDPIEISWDGDVVDLCQGEIINLDASTPNVSNYSWNTGAVTSEIIIHEGGFYIVTMTDDDGACSGMATFEVEQRLKPYIPELTEGVYCEGDTVLLNAGIDGEHYSWSTGATTQTIKAFETGNYHVIVETEYGCLDTAYSVLEFYPKARYDEWEMLHISGYKYQFILHNPVNVLEYHWDFGDGTTSSLATPIHEYEGAGVYTSFLTLSSMCGDQEFYKIIELQDKVGVDEWKKNDVLNIHPNPTRDALNVSLEPLNDNIKAYRIIDASGKTIMEQTSLHEKSIIVDVKNLNEGVFFIEVTTQNEQIKQTFIKIK